MLAILQVWGYIKMFPKKGIFVNLRPTKFSSVPHNVNVDFLKELYPGAAELILLSRDTDGLMGDVQL